MIVESIRYEKQQNLTANITVDRYIHRVWQEWDWMRKMKPSPLTTHLHTPIVGKYGYRYYSKKGEISLVELPNYFLDGIDLWEIMALKGPEELTNEEERFHSKAEAEVRIKELLD